MVTKSQKELEQPAKGYELLAVANALDDFKKDTNKRLDEISNKLDGIATCKYVDEKILDSERRMELKYGRPIKKIDKFVWLIIAAAVGAFITSIPQWIKIVLGERGETQCNIFAG